MFQTDIDIIGDFSDLTPAIYGETRVGSAIYEMNELKRIYDFDWFFESTRIVILGMGVLVMLPMRYGHLMVWKVYREYTSER